jgi:uncharacterized membrane protein
MTGGMVTRYAAAFFNEGFHLRVFNEASVVGIITSLWVVVVKPLTLLPD